MTQAQSRTAARCPTSGANSVPELHKEWILVGWDKPVAGQSWDFREKLGKYYDWEANDVVLNDDMSPDFRIARSPEEYRALWELSFQALRRAHHLVLNGPEAIVGEKLSTSTMEFAARLEPPRASRSSRFAHARRSCGGAPATGGRLWANIKARVGSRLRSPANSSVSSPEQAEEYAAT